VVFTRYAAEAFTTGSVEVLLDQHDEPLAACIWFDHTAGDNNRGGSGGSAGSGGRDGDGFAGMLTGGERDRWVLLERAMDAARPGGRHEYLMLAGVLPGQQGKGLGTRLLDHHHEVLDAAGTGAYLEATSPGSRALYTRLGYHDHGRPFHPEGTGPGADGAAPGRTPRVRGPGHGPRDGTRDGATGAAGPAADPGERRAVAGMRVPPAGARRWPLALGLILTPADAPGSGGTPTAGDDETSTEDHLAVAVAAYQASYFLAHTVTVTWQASPGPGIADDDQARLRGLARRTDAGALFVLTRPAQPRHPGQHDDEHHRYDDHDERVRAELLLAEQLKALEPMAAELRLSVHLVPPGPAPGNPGRDDRPG
jgi:ribosomal protein S18 acetylase RimI-like enzyme